MEESLSINRTFTHTKVSPHRHLLITRENANFRGGGGGKPGTHHLHHMTKNNITKNNTNRHHVPPERIYWEYNIPSLTFPPKRQNPESNHEGTPEKSKCRTVYKMSYAFRIRQSHDTQRQNEELFQIKGAQQTDITNDLGFSFPIKGIIGTIDQSEIRFAGWIMVVYEHSFPNFDNCTVIM